MSSYDPLDTRDQDRAKSEKEVRDRMESENESIDIKWLMGNKRGRRIIWRLLDQSGVFRLSFNSNSMTMAFNEGQRNFGNRMLAMIHTLCPELYPAMLKESQNARINDDGIGPNDQ
jgi:hypothetical protein